MTHFRIHAPAALGLLAPLLLLAACNKADAPAAAAPAERVATVNGKPLPKSEFELYVANMTRQSGREVAEEQKGAAARSVHQHAARGRRGREGGRRQGSEGRATSWRSRGCNVLVDAGLQKYLEAHPVQDAELQPEYDAQVAALPREYHARHILVDDKAAAEAITKELKGGADFAKLAAKKLEGLLQQERRRSRLVHARHDGQAVRRRGRERCSPVSSPSSRCRASSAGTSSSSKNRAPPAPPPFDEVKDRVKMIVQRKKLQTLPGRAAQERRRWRRRLSAPADGGADRPMTPKAELGRERRTDR